MLSAALQTCFNLSCLSECGFFHSDDCFVFGSQVLTQISLPMMTLQMKVESLLTISQLQDIHQDAASGCQKLGNKLHNIMMHIQIFHEDLLIDIIINSNHVRKLIDYLVTVFMDEFMKLFHIFWHFADDWLPCVLINFNEYSTGLETTCY